MAVNLQSMVELSISCSNLIRLDVLSKSDPMVAVYVRNSLKKWEEIGRTEAVSNSQNPRFATPVPVPYRFEEVQHLRFVVVDVDDPKKSLKGQDRVGVVKTTLGEIVGSMGNTMHKPIVHKKHPTRKNGLLTVTATEVASNDLEVEMSVSGSKLDKKDLFGKSDPFLVFHRMEPSGVFTPVHKTEIKKKTLDPVWDKFAIPKSRLCAGRDDVPIMIECFDWDSDGSHDMIGTVTVTFADLRQPRPLTLVHPKHKDKPKSSGTLMIVTREYKVPTFLDFVTGGTEISLIVGVDYTGSNGSPGSPSSLHYQRPDGLPNEYQAAIRVIGDILLPYDNDRWIPAFGFGAKIGNDTHHIFPLNGLGQNPNCMGVDGVLAAYQASFQWLSLSGPTNFASILTHVSDLARQVKGGERYYILLMITDGEISDMGKTVQQIREAAGLPLSVVIVGVGSADFGKMNTLDGDDGELKSKRDIVQFVPFRKFATLPLANLAKETLAEVPKQLVTYMKSRGIVPAPPVAPPPPPAVV